MRLRPTTLFLVAVSLAWALAGGSLSGVLKDPSGAVIPGVKLTLVNVALKTEFEAATDSRGFYSFPALPVGRYDLTIEAAGFQSQKKTNIAIDADAAVTLNDTLEVGQQSEAITVSATEANVQTQVETVATHLGEVVEDTQIQAHSSERPQLHGPARHSTGRQSGHHSDSDFGHHGRSHGHHQPIG